MVDQGNLLANLQEYRIALNKHLSILQEDLPELNKCWYALDSVSKGDAAEDFKGNWEGTLEWLENHIHEIQNILTLLDRHIDSLQQFDFSQEP